MQVTRANRILKELADGSDQTLNELNNVIGELESEQQRRQRKAKDQQAGE